MRLKSSFFYTLISIFRYIYIPFQAIYTQMLNNPGMRTLKLSTFVIVIILSAFSCQKTDTSAGKGGSANVTLYLKHHGVARNLTNCKVYVKYNTMDAPANGVYDDSATASSADTMQTAVFTGLKNGNYYFYGKGCDTSLFEQVVTGLPVVVASQSNQSDVLPVSENSLPCN